MPERASTPAEPIRIELTADERELLRHGLRQWGDPADLSDPMAVALGFASPADFSAAAGLDDGFTLRTLWGLQRRLPVLLSP